VDSSSSVRMPRSPSLAYRTSLGAGSQSPNRGRYLIFAPRPLERPVAHRYSF
jgi:hypothetical protein